MENQKNNKGVITLLIVIIVLLSALCVLFATGTISFNSNEVNNDDKTNNNIQENNPNSEINDMVDLNEVTSISQFPIDDDQENENDVLLNSTFENIYGRLTSEEKKFRDKGDEINFIYNNVKYSAVCDGTTTEGYIGCEHITLKINNNTIFSNGRENPLLIVTSDNIIVRESFTNGTLGSIYILDAKGTLLKKVTDVVGWYDDGLLNDGSDVVVKNNILYYLTYNHSDKISLKYILLYDDKLNEKTIEEFDGSVK